MKRYKGTYSAEADILARKMLEDHAQQIVDHSMLFMKTLSLATYGAHTLALANPDDTYHEQIVHLLHEKQETIIREVLKVLAPEIKHHEQLNKQSLKIFNQWL